jgi:hypothetical protein
MRRFAIAVRSVRLERVPFILPESRFLPSVICPAEVVDHALQLEQK